jgi:Tfp pilus assembly protein PilF
VTKSKRPKTKQAAQDPTLLFERALDASLNHEDEVSISALQEVLRIDPSHARGHYLLGAEYAQTGDVEAALREMTAAVKLDPSLVLARFQSWHAVANVQTTRRRHKSMDSARCFR